MIAVSIRIAVRLGIAAVSACVAMSAASCGILRDDTANTVAGGSAEVQSGTVTESAASDAQVTGSVDAVFKPTELTVEDGQFSFDELCSYVRANPTLTRINTGSALLTAEQYVTLATIAENADVVSRINIEGIETDLSTGEVDLSGTVISDKEAFPL